MEGTHRFFSEEELKPAIELLENELYRHERKLNLAQLMIADPTYTTTMDTIIQDSIFHSGRVLIYKEAILKLKADVQRELQEGIIGLKEAKRPMTKEDWNDIANGRD